MMCECSAGARGGRWGDGQRQVAAGESFIARSELWRVVVVVEGRESGGQDGQEG